MLYIFVGVFLFFFVAFFWFLKKVVLNARVVKHYILSQKALNEYIGQNFKKRKNAYNELKNNNKTAKSIHNYQYLQILLPDIDILNFSKLLKKENSNLLFVEKILQGKNMM